MPKEVFLSHSSADHGFATELTEVLRRHGIPVWYSNTDPKGAQQWHDEIGEALQRCDWFVLLLSPDAVASKWVKRETLFSLQQNRFEERIVPVLYRCCSFEKLSWVLPQLQIVDFRFDFDSGYRDLLSIWGIGYRPSFEPGTS